jgi:preprotein translocase subunit SecD
LSAQENDLKTGFYSVVENDSCGTSGNYLKIMDDAEEYCIDKVPLITSSNFTSVRIDSDTTKEGIFRTVRIKLDSALAKEFKETTMRLVGKRLAFIINNKIITAPVLRDPIESGEIAVFCDDETINVIRREFDIK